jgi:hypothetical protein
VLRQDTAGAGEQIMRKEMARFFPGDFQPPGTV